MYLGEVYTKAKDDEYLFHYWNGRHYKKSELRENDPEIEVFPYGVSDEWEIKTQKQMDERDY